MRLWHEKLIPILPSAQLNGQHQECCALRGNGWGKKHSTINYIFNHSPYKLYKFHLKVMNERFNRGYKVDEQWLNKCYRGKVCKPYESLQAIADWQYKEHNDEYLIECIHNLLTKLIRQPGKPQLYVFLDNLVSIGLDKSMVKAIYIKVKEEYK